MDEITDDTIPMVLVIAFEVPASNDDPGPAQQMLDRVKPLFADKPDVKVYGAIRETAEAIVEVLSQGT